MAIIRAQIAFQHDSALPEDQSVNTLYFNSGSPGTGDYDDIDAALVEFYSTAVPAGGTIVSLLSAALTGVAVTKLYNLLDTPPRTPVATYSNSFTVGTGLRLPAEVACVLSFQATPASGQIQARRRGRIYIGPLDASACQDSDGDRPSQSVRDILCEAAERLRDTALADSIPWVVWSETGQSFVGVDEGWVDNSFDTQRRRGEAPTSRQLWS